MPPHTRKLRWVALVLLLLGAVWLSYRLFDRLAEVGPEPGLNQVVLPTLSLAVVVLALALAGVLIRNLVRLIVDHKRGILGARLRTKLVFFFLALVLLPALVLFSGSAQVIKQSVEAVLRTPLEELTRRSGRIVEQWKNYVQDEALAEARAVADAIAGTDAGPEAIRDLVRRWPRHEHRQIRVSRGTGVLARSSALDPALDGARGRELDRLLDALIQRVTQGGESATRIDYLGDGLVAHAAVPVGGEDAVPLPVVVSVAIVLPRELAGDLGGIDEAARAYRQFRVQRRELVRLYLTLIGLVFLATLFVATWIGFYVSRRITGPIQQLAAATREVAAGNLGVRVRTEIGDELGMLVDAFNDMAAELQENRAVIVRSTADLRRSNRALDERRRYIETLLANLSTAVLSLDPAGRVTTANPAVRSILGVELAVGDAARQAFRDQRLEPLADLLDQAAELTGESVRKDLTLMREDQALNVSVQVTPLRRISGEQLGTLVMVEDLTELLRAQKAAAWREVARRIAHEIKNPLTPIQLAAQRLRKKFSEGAADLDRVMDESTASIEHEVGALKRLVDEFSLFARLPEIAPRSVELAAVIDSARGLYRGLGDIEWDVSVDPRIGCVHVDPDQMRRVLINLIDNAVAAMRHRGTIHLHARRLDVEHSVRIEVADHGPGIDPADFDKMFSPYFSTKQRGTGLGLAIVHKIVTDHGGTIRVERNEPSGVRFVIELPDAERPADRVAAVEERHGRAPATQGEEDGRRTDSRR